jgi:hypothetical protein
VLPVAFASRGVVAFATCIPRDGVIGRVASSPKHVEKADQVTLRG